MKVYFGSDNISELIQSSMDKIKAIMDSTTIIGDRIDTADGYIIPITKVTVGYVVGGGEYNDMSKHKGEFRYPMTGGSSGGISVTPVGFLVENNGEVSYINVENKTAFQTMVNMFNTAMSKIQKEDNDGKEE